MKYLPLHSLRAGLALLSAFLLLASFQPLTAAEERRGVDYSHYDVPLYEQLVAHIQARIAARLGPGKLAHDRYFIIPFAYENRGNKPEFSHSFLSVVRVFGDGSAPSLDAGLKVHTYKHWRFEAFTISWLPNDFDKNPHLCVFEGFGARLFPSRNECPLSPGHSFTLAETIKMAVAAKVAVGMWGPYEITKPAFELGVKRMRLLNSGALKYRADDRGYRKNRVAINCFHAMAGLEELFPNGGLFGTGFKMWGLNGTRRVLIEYQARASRQGLLLQKVDIKKDLDGFVYAPTRDARGVYNPFGGATAYHQ